MCRGDAICGREGEGIAYYREILEQMVRSRTTEVAVIGLGYVGLAVGTRGATRNVTSPRGAIEHL